MGHSTTIVDYLGVGLLASRPATPNIETGCGSLWFSTDAVVPSLWTGSAWLDLTLVPAAGVVVSNGTALAAAVLVGLGLSGGTLTNDGVLSLGGVGGTLGLGPNLSMSGTILEVAAGAGGVVTIGGLAGAVILGANLSVNSGQTIGVTGLGSMAFQSSGAVAITGGSITGLGTPVNPSDAATKSYVDASILGLQIKQTATVATTAALPASTYNNGTAGVGATITVIATGTLTIDGHVTALGDLVLVKNEATAENNGLYLVTTAGAVGVQAVLTRDTDMNTAADFSGAMVPVGATGSTNANSLWLANPSTPVTVGTTAIPFTSINPLLQDGNNISISGNVISVASMSGGIVVSNGTSLEPGVLGPNLTLAAGNTLELVGVELQSNKGTANGYAGLDGNGYVPLSQMQTEITFTDLAIPFPGIPPPFTTGPPSTGRVAVMVQQTLVLKANLANTSMGFIEAASGTPSFVLSTRHAGTITARGTLTINSGGTVTTSGTGTLDVTLDPGDMVICDPPASPDATLADGCVTVRLLKVAG